MKKYYYYYNETMDGFIAVSEIDRHPCMSDERNIPLENAMLENGAIYDNREVNYWRIAKTKELDRWFGEDEKRIIPVFSINFLASEKRIDQLTKKWVRLTLNGSKSNIPQVTDSDGNKHDVTREQFDEICRVLGDASENRDIKQKAVIRGIKQAKTIEELKAIVI